MTTAHKYDGPDRREDCSADGCPVVKGQGKGQKLLWAVVLAGVFCSPIATVTWMSAEVRTSNQAVLTKLDAINEAFSRHKADNARFEGSTATQLEWLKQRKE